MERQTEVVASRRPGCRPTVPSIGESEPFGRIRSTERRSAMQEQNRSLSIVSSLAVVGLLLLVALAAGIAIANAAEIIPAAGLTRSVNGDQANAFGSLA